MTISTLEQAKLEAKQGNIAGARAILARLVKAEPQNSDAWLLLAEILDNPQQASYCRDRAQSVLKSHAPPSVPENEFQEDPAEPVQNGENKVQTKCPFCAEFIPFDARVCPYCGRNVTIPVSSGTSSPQLASKPTTLQQKKKPGSYGTNLILACIVAIVVVCGCLVLAALLEGASTYDVRYEIIGSASAASVTWMNSQGGIEQGDFNLPFRKSFSFDSGGYASLTAQNYYNSGSISCQIWVNDVLWRESTSSGAYSIALCNGIVGEP